MWITVEKLKDSFSMSWHWSYAFAWWNRFRNVIQTCRYALRSCQLLRRVVSWSVWCPRNGRGGRSSNSVDLIISSTERTPCSRHVVLSDKLSGFRSVAVSTFNYFLLLTLLYVVVNLVIYISPSLSDPMPPRLTSEASCCFQLPGESSGGNLRVMLGFEPQTILQSTNFIEIIQLVLVC